MLPNRARNFVLAFLGFPLPVDVAMMQITEELKATIAGMTTEEQRLSIVARFPEAHLAKVFSESPVATKEDCHV